MKRTASTILSWFVLTMLLVACNSTTPTTAPTIAPTIAPTQTLSPTITPTATPAPIVFPSARGYHSMAYDSESKRVIMYGGQTGDYKVASNFSFETWSFDPASNLWMKMTPSINPGGTIGDMTYDSKADRVILVVNADNSNPTTFDYKTSQTWAYDFNTDTWTRLADGPSGRLGARVIYDSKADKVILFGGYAWLANKYFDETWVYDYTANTWKQMQPTLSPGARNFHCMAYDSAADRTVVWGGDVGGALKISLPLSLWVYDHNKNTWTEVKYEKGMIGLDYWGIVYDEKADVFILFGAVPPNSASTWVYDLNSNTWQQKQPAQSPGGLTRHTLVYDTSADRAILFGGQLGTAQFNFLANTWIYDLNANTWTNAMPEQ